MKAGIEKIEGRKRHKNGALMHQLYMLRALFVDTPYFLEHISVDGKFNSAMFLGVSLVGGLLNYLRKGSSGLISFITIPISILIFTIFILVLVKIAKGKMAYVKVMNLVSYVHVLIIIGGLFQDMQFIAMIVYSYVQFKGVFLQRAVLPLITGADQKRINIITGIEYYFVVHGLISNLLAAFGYYMIYSEKYFYFPLVG